MQNVRQACVTVVITIVINIATFSKAGVSGHCRVNTVRLRVVVEYTMTRFFKLAVPVVHPWIELQ